MELYISGLTMRTNEIVRVLTVISSIFIPLTFIAGVYGMNFDRSSSVLNMPELSSPIGYPVVLLVMAAVAGGMLLYFRRKRWL
jgi:magnesium transporter